jgi:phage host-nuclease inhibitor protein Gam
MQEEMFGSKYTPEDIERIKGELSRDVERLDDLREEKAAMVKGYNENIKLLQERVNNKAKIVNHFRSESTSIKDILSDVAHELNLNVSNNR